MEIFIDCAAIASREALHHTFASALSFPAWYGKNLDALYDCLSGICACIHLQHWEQAEAALGNYGKNARRVLCQAAENSEKLEVFFE